MLERAESWNAKMLSGAPLITEEQFEALLANPPKSFVEMEDHDPVPAVTIFLPHMRWLLAWIYPDDLDLAYCAVKRGNNEPEAGDVRLSDIAASRLGSGEISIRPERDKYIRFNKPLSFYLDNPEDW